MGVNNLQTSFFPPTHPTKFVTGGGNLYTHDHLVHLTNPTRVRFPSRHTSRNRIDRSSSKRKSGGRRAIDKTTTISRLARDRCPPPPWPARFDRALVAAAPDILGSRLPARTRKHMPCFIFIANRDRDLYVGLCAIKDPTRQ